MVRISRLDVEQLEDRQMLAIFIDPIPEIRIDEGSAATLDAYPFTDSSPGGSYTAEVVWTEGANAVSASGTTPGVSASRLNVRFDYRYDSNGFFGEQQRLLLETAAELIVGRLGDQLAPFTSSGSNQFTAQFIQPETGGNTSVASFSVAANEIVVFVGARDLEDENLAAGGAGGGSGREPFFTQATTRGQSGAPTFDVGPWGGSISFDSEVEWHFDISSEDLDRNKNDFLSVAVHEIMHVLGFARGTESFEGLILAGGFRGNAVRNLLGGSNAPLSEDLSHFEEGLEFDGQETAMDPALRRGDRKLPTELDFAVLDDIGWELLPETEPGTVTASNVYADNGTYDAILTVTNGDEMAAQSFRVVVDNVAPTIVPPVNITGLAGQPINLNIAFTDPGQADTHSAMVDWGDGFGGDINVNQGTRSVTGEHVYELPGTYQARVAVTDDDGGSTIQQFQVTVTAAPHGGWQNPQNRFDVSNDGAVAPLDALLVINELNERNFSAPITGLLPPAPSNIPEFLDVTGDGFVSPQDALDVINTLSSAAIRVPTSPTAPLSVQLADVWAGFERNGLDENDEQRENLWNLLARNILTPV